MANSTFESRLRPPGSFGEGRSYWRQAWAMRHFAVALGSGSAKASTQSRLLGNVWQFLEPALEILLYWLVFGVILDVSRGVDNFLAFLTVGRIVYGFLQRTLLGAANSMISQVPMLRSLAFPRIVMPAAEVVKSSLLARAEVVVLFGALLLMGVVPRPSWLLLPLVLGVGAIITFGLGAALARHFFRMPDLSRFLLHLMRLNLYASGVVFPITRFVESETLQRLAAANPFYCLIEVARWTVMGIRPEHQALTTTSVAIWTALAALLGTLHFVRGEQAFASSKTPGL